MAEEPVVAISFHETDADEELRQTIDRRCQALAEEFPETTRFEITLSPDGNGHTAHARVHARQLEIETHGDAIELSLAVDQALDKVARRLRREHDKRIDTRRRAAQKASPKRSR